MIDYDFMNRLTDAKHQVATFVEDKERLLKEKKDLEARIETRDRE